MQAPWETLKRTYLNALEDRGVKNVSQKFEEPNRHVSGHEASPAVLFEL
jgi:hypothetical protein